MTTSSEISGQVRSRGNNMGDPNVIQNDSTENTNDHALRRIRFPGRLTPSSTEENLSKWRASLSDKSSINSDCPEGLKTLFQHSKRHSFPTLEAMAKLNPAYIPDPSDDGDSGNYSANGHRTEETKIKHGGSLPRGRKSQDRTSGADMSQDRRSVEFTIGPSLGNITEETRPPDTYDPVQASDTVPLLRDDIQNVQEDEPAAKENPEYEARKSRMKKWNVFRIVTADNLDEGTERLYEVVRKIMKVMTYIIIFLIVLGGTIISKGTLMFIASNMRPDLNVSCVTVNKTHTNGNITTFTQEIVCVALQPGTNGTGQPCPSGKPKIYTMCKSVTLRWVWAGFLVVCTPYLLVFLRSLWKICFKKKKAPALDILLLVMIVESMHAVGVAMLVFRVLPLLNAVQGVLLMLGCSFLPSVLKAFNRPMDEEIRQRVLRVILDVAAVLTQVLVLAFWPAMMSTHERFFGDQYVGHADGLVWLIPVSLLLMSVRYWENYVDSSTRFGLIGVVLCQIRTRIRKAKTKIYVFVSLWKCVITFAMMLALLAGKVGSGPRDLFNFSSDNSTCPSHQNKATIEIIRGLRLDWVWVSLINIVCGMAVYYCAMNAAKVQIQRLSFALPLALATPVCVAILTGACAAWNKNHCAFGNGTAYIFFHCHPVSSTFGHSQHVWVGVLWWLSQLWIGWHIWWPAADRLARTEKLFVKPLWEGPLLEQNLLHNRARNDEELRRVELTQLKFEPMSDEDDTELRDENSRIVHKKVTTPFIYLCATMWHETAEEMIQLLKSVFRLDIDQAARRNVQDFFHIEDPDYYEFECHIFFDDAFEFHGDDVMEYKANDFVKRLVQVMDISASSAHGDNIKVPSPIKYLAPYGGRLEWILPGGNKILAHLKDKVKIRHKKRWSQCMYMYYMLGYRLWNEVMDLRTKQKRADNTFLMALDGDVDFQPNALTLLVDIMKKNYKVGAACGRIHPIGNGPMVWYQKFEYSLGHWMQKATEHVLGCVLCSPGCFSLFRGSALMDDNVMKMYTTMSTEASHYVQYDQGEDRWLCTLLLQQGYRVEYCAASDALTYAPEGFNEFFNQRRRWMPSTMANILDLLRSWKQTTRMNDSLSIPYIIYQTLLFASSVIGPGTIFLMIVGAIQNAFPGTTQTVAFIINFVPVLIFIILCFVGKPDTQLFFAQVMSALYCLVQMLVLIGILVRIRQDGVCSPTALFFFFVFGTFVLAALLHPQEFFNLFYGIVYFVSIPSMYMLLIIYGMTNMHVVSWGTREVTVTKTEKEILEAKKLEEEQKDAAKNKSTVGALMSKFKLGAGNTEEEGFTFSIGDLFRCVCCPRPKPKQDEYKYNSILDELKGVKEELKFLSRQQQSFPFADPPNSPSHFGPAPNWNHNHGVLDVHEIDPDHEAPEVVADTETEEEHHETPKSPTWIDDNDLQNGTKGQLDEKEKYFFEDLIKEYLFPLVKDKIREERVAHDLKELRNKSAFSFILMNTLFIVTIFAMQMQQTQSGLYIPWPCPRADGSKMFLEPIGVMFLFVFGVIMLIQIIGMLIHRIGTALHIVSTTRLRCRRAKEVPTDDNLSDAMHLAKRLGEAKREEDAMSVASMNTTPSAEADEDYMPGRRGMVKRLHKNAKRDDKRVHTISKAFQERFQQFQQRSADEQVSDEELRKRVLGREGQNRGRMGRDLRAIRTIRLRATGRRGLPRFSESNDIADMEARAGVNYPSHEREPCASSTAGLVTDNTPPSSSRYRKRYHAPPPPPQQGFDGPPPAIRQMPRLSIEMNRFNNRRFSSVDA